MYYKLGRAGKALDRFGVIEFATTIAPGRARRAAHRQGLRGRAAQQPQQARAIRYDAVVLDAPPTGPDRPVPQRQQRARRAGQGRADQEPGRQRDDAASARRAPPSTWSRCSRRCRCRRPPTASRTCARPGCRSAAWSSTWSAPATSTSDDLDAARAGTLDRAATCTPTCRGRRRRPATSARRRAARRGPRPRRAPGPRGRPARAGRRARASRRTSCPASRAASTWAASTSWPPTSSDKDCAHDERPQPRPRRPPVGPATGRAARWTSTRCSTTRRTGIIVCCGSGGVGKTTTSAALALRAAERGRKVVVLTIDPARRLAQSMGIEALDNTPRPVVGVDDRRRAAALDAMMLDMKRTFDEVVESQATPEKARQILENPFYVALSSSFAGTQEYMAMEKLGQIHADAQPRRHLRPDRRRHAAVALGAGLPRRPRAALELPRRPVHPAAARARAGPGPDDDRRARA